MEDFDELPLEEELLFTPYPGIRIFSLNNNQQTTLLGILVEETDDSFLVGLPSRMVKDEKTEDLSVVPYLPATFYRLLKTSVEGVLFMEDPFLSEYHKYVVGMNRPEFEEILPILFENFEEEPRTVEADDLEEKLQQVSLEGGFIIGSNTKH